MSSPADTAPHAPDGGREPAAGEAQLLERHQLLRLIAPNPGPLTLSGTNTWVLGRDPAWVIDPGPLLEEHLARVSAAIEARGGLGGVALTHDHPDHAEGARALLERHPAPLAAGRVQAEGTQPDVLLEDGTRFGPLQAIATPGHALDHFALLAGGVCFSGDALLGEGSVFISSYRGAMAGYLDGLRRLLLREEIELICPGHGPLVREPRARLEEYLAHRLEREARLIEALRRGRRTVAELLDAAWGDVPQALRPLAEVTLAAHLDKLEDEKTLPPGVERPSLHGSTW